MVLDSASLAAPRTKVLAAHVAKLGWTKALVIDGEAVETNFAKAARNLVGIDVLPTQGANVYDILRHGTLVLTRAAVDKLQERLA
jgi:large subunit ribosomal protein L4